MNVCYRADLTAEKGDQPGQLLSAEPSRGVNVIPGGDDRRLIHRRSLSRDETTT
ncbi:MAG: hypothetical protein ACRECE_03075 [Xanthobacteraceae bacterium]